MAWLIYYLLTDGADELFIRWKQDSPGPIPGRVFGWTLVGFWALMLVMVVQSFFWKRSDDETQK